MIVTCSTCGLKYDDTYRLTYCPHEHFNMHCVVCNSRGVVGVATSLEELDRSMRMLKNRPGKSFRRLKKFKQKQAAFAVKRFREEEALKPKQRLTRIREEAREHRRELVARRQRRKIKENDTVRFR